MAKSTPLTLIELNEFLPRLQATVELLAGEAAHAKAMARHAGARMARGAAEAAKASNGVAAGQSAKGAKAGKARRGRRMTPDQTAKLRQQILSTLSGKKGLALGEVIKRTGGDRSAVSFQLRRLRDEKKARVVGNRQLARWFSR